VFWWQPFWIFDAQGTQHYIFAVKTFLTLPLHFLTQKMWKTTYTACPILSVIGRQQWIANDAQCYIVCIMSVNTRFHISSILDI